MNQPPYGPSQQPPYGQNPPGSYPGEQYGYMPPAGPPPRRSWVARNKALTVVLGLFALFIVPLGGSGPSQSGGDTAGTTASSATSSAAIAAAPSSPSCSDQAVYWRDNGGKDDLAAVSSDLGSFVTASHDMVSALDGGSDLPSAESEMQSASTSLQSDEQAARADLPPSCIPDLRQDEGKAMTYYATAAGDSQNAISELSSGSEDVAVGDIKAADKAMNEGNDKLNAAAADL